MTSDRVEQLIKQAQDDRDRGWFNEAIAACQTAIVLDPGCTPAYQILGDAFQDRGQLEAARRAYARASELQNISDIDPRETAEAIARGNGEGKIVFFSPDGSIVPHFAAQCVLARTLKELGHDVLFARCTGSLERCPVMNMYRLPYNVPPETKARVCQECSRTSAQMLNAYGLESIEIGRFMTSELRDRVEKALENPPADLRDFEFDGIGFGKLCIIDLVLETKKHKFEAVDAPTYQSWLKQIQGSLMAYLLVDRLCQQLPVSRLVYFNDYAVMLGSRMAARQHGITTFSMTQASHIGVDRRRYLLSQQGNLDLYAKQVRSWPQWRELSLLPDRVREVADDLIARFGAKSQHVYSPAKTFSETDLYAQLGLSKDKALLVAYTSSLDEVIGTRINMNALGLPIQERPQPFVDQIEWLQYLTEYVEDRNDMQLVVRVHPREGKNRRESAISEHLAQLKENFDRPWQNCYFVWPEDPISSYDLGEIADLALTSLSTIGLELARLGVPVLASVNAIGLTLFPEDDFIEWVPTRKDYFQKVMELLGRSTVLETIARSFRYYNLLFLESSLNLKDVVPNSDFMGLPEFQFSREAKAIEEAIVHRRPVLEINLERLQQLQNQEVKTAEKLAIRQQLRRMLHFLIVGEDSIEDYQLICTEPTENWEKSVQQGLEKTSRFPDLRLILVRQGEVCYIVGKDSYSKYSPMCDRLARLCAQHTQ